MRLTSATEAPLCSSSIVLLIVFVISFASFSYPFGRLISAFSSALAPPSSLFPAPSSVARVSAELRLNTLLDTLTEYAERSPPPLHSPSVARRVTLVVEKRRALRFRLLLDTEEEDEEDEEDELLLRCVSVQAHAARAHGEAVLVVVIIACVIIQQGPSTVLLLTV